MKHWILNIPQRLRSVSNGLDAKALLCDKSWAVYNDEDIRQVFVFFPDGRLIISSDGIVAKSEWIYISANSGLVILSSNKSVMYHLCFADNNVVALELDGGQREYLVLLNEKNPELSSMMVGLQSYFDKLNDRFSLDETDNGLRSSMGRGEKDNRVDEMSGRNIEAASLKDELSTLYKRVKDLFTINPDSLKILVSVPIVVSVIIGVALVFCFVGVGKSYAYAICLGAISCLVLCALAGGASLALSFHFRKKRANACAEVTSFRNKYFINDDIVELARCSQDIDSFVKKVYDATNKGE